MATLTKSESDAVSQFQPLIIFAGEQQIVGGTMMQLRQGPFVPGLGLRASVSKPLAMVSASEAASTRG